MHTILASVLNQLKKTTSINVLSINAQLTSCIEILTRSRESEAEKKMIENLLKSEHLVRDTLKHINNQQTDLQIEFKKFERLKRLISDCYDNRSGEIHM